VAVSLDGPERVHDRFRGRQGSHRGALEAVRYYLSVVPGRTVTAGTTVTTRNFRHLSKTFFEVVASGATAWGLHLLVPEGRARGNRRLFLSRRQLRTLVDFCAARRSHFPVTMADEIGCLGEEEPLVRDEPFFCGAGRTQCVVLPGGEVVPCSTLDRSVSAGSVLERPLAEIWAEGFAELRHWQPEGRCRSCAYAPACRGGCWLQRRHGTQCFRAVWRAPRLAGAAAAAVCLGLGSATAGETAPEGQNEIPADQAQQQEIMYGPAVMPEPPVEAAEALERYIVGWYTSQYPGRGRGDPVWSRDWLDSPPAAKTAAGAYAIGFVSGRKEAGLAARCKAVREGLKDGPVTSSLAALMWRDLCEAALDDLDPVPRNDGELRRAMTELSARAEEARARAVGPTLEAFASGRHPAGWSMVGKAGPTRHQTLQNRLFRNRWVWEPVGLKQDGRGYTVAVGGKALAFTEAAIREYLQAYPFGHSLTVRAECRPEDGLVLLRGGREEQLAGAFEFRICDFLKVPEGGATLALGGKEGTLKASVKLPAGAELGHPDILRLAWEQNRKELLDVARTCQGWADRFQPLLLPALREAAASRDPEVADRARRWLIELWLF
jgi:radical SAM protein with 4Fe4S-binding SPASM domain